MNISNIKEILTVFSDGNFSVLAHSGKAMLPKLPFLERQFLSQPLVWSQQTKTKSRSHRARETFTCLTYWVCICCPLPHQCHCGWWWHSQQGWEYLEWWLADADPEQELGNYKKMWYGGGCSQPESRLEMEEHPERTCKKKAYERWFRLGPSKYNRYLFPRTLWFRFTKSLSQYI